MVKTELKKGIQKDSLLFGLKFGDHKQVFFDRCLELNKKGLVIQGPSNKYAQYNLKPGADSTNIIMLFYATNQDNGIIDGMDIKFYHSGWAPWNKQLYNYVLAPKVKDSLLTWFPGNDFLKVNLENGQIVHIKVDGNRQIKVYNDPNNKDVSVQIENLNNKYDAKEL